MKINIHKGLLTLLVITIEGCSDIENTNSSKGSTSTSNAPSTTPSSQKPSPTKPSTSGNVSKGNVIRNDKITQKGPTHIVKTDQAKITIKFLDEATNKPLSGLTYWTQSTKYGKNPSTTGSDPCRQSRRHKLGRF